MAELAYDSATKIEGFLDTNWDSTNVAKPNLDVNTDVKRIDMRNGDYILIRTLTETTRRAGMGVTKMEIIGTARVQFFTKESRARLVALVKEFRRIIMNIQGNPDEDICLITPTNYTDQTGDTRKMYRASYEIEYITYGADFGVSNNIQNDPTLSNGIRHYYKKDQDGIDAQGGLNSTITGATVAAGIINESYLYDGVNDRGITNNIPNYANMSISFWFNPSSNPGNDTVISKAIGFSPGEIAYYIDISGGNLRYRVNTGGTLSGLINVASVVTGTWYHAVLTWDGTALKGYVNSVEVLNNTSLTAGDLLSLAAPLEFAARVNTNQYNGRLDEIGIWNRAIDQDEVTRLYNNGEALPYGNPPTLVPIINHPTLNTDLQFYYDFDTDATDRLGNNDGALNGAIITGGASGIQGGEAVQFDGVNDFVSFGLSWTVGNDQTWSTWIKTTTLNGYICDHRIGNTSNGILITTNNGGTIQVSVFGSGSVVGSIVVTDDALHHLVVTKSGNLYTIYIDNVEDTSGNLGSTNASYPTRFGTRTTGTAPYGGTLDEFGYWNRVLTTDEISDLYNGGAGIPYD